MNIFFTDRSPIEAARNLDDLRLNKMISESNQMMVAAIETYLDPKVRKKYKRLVNYPPSVPKHPCTLWVAQSHQHYMWLRIHTYAMLGMWGDEHKGRHTIDSIKHYKFDDNGWIDPPNCTDFKHINNIVTAYRTAMIHKWNNDKRPPRWSRGNRKPTWIAERN